MFKKILQLASIIFCLFTFFFFSPTHAAKAESIVFTGTIPITKTNFSGTITLSKFDPSLGILQGVEISMTSTLTGTAGYENGDNVATPIDFVVHASVSTMLPDSTTLADEKDVINRTDNAGAFDGVVDFGGTSGATYPYEDLLTKGKSYSSEAALSAYIGVGNFSLAFNANVVSTATGPGNVDTRVRTNGGASVVVRYLYVIPTIEIEKLVNGAIADGPNDPDVPGLRPGDPVTWTYRITNTSSVTIPLASVNLTDNVPGVTPTRVVSSDQNGDDLLSPGESWTYTATGSVLDLTVSPPAGVTILPGCNPSGQPAPGQRPAYQNIGTVRVPGTSVSDPAHYCNPANPAIVLVKRTNGADANDPNGSDVPVLAPGAPVTWTYLITNTGNITFAQNSVVVTDSHISITPTLVTSTDVNSDQLLSPGESWTYIATGIAPNLSNPPAGTTTVAGCNPSGQPAPGQRPAYENIGRVTVPGATDDDPSHFCNPAIPGIVLTKLTNGFDANTPNGSDVPLINPGATVTWTYIVTNTGNITFAFASVVLTDSNPGITPTLVSSTDANSDLLLSPNETWRYTATAPALVLTGSLPTGVVTVPGCNPSGSPQLATRPAYQNIGRVTVPGATDDDPSHYCNNPIPGIKLVKTVYRTADAPNGAGCPGDELVEDFKNTPVTYCFEITNTGETFLDNLVFTDTLLNITSINQLTQISGTLPLAPAAKLLYYVESTIPVGGRLNVAKLEGNPTDSNGADLPGLQNPTDDDDARVTEKPTSSDGGQEPLPMIYLPYLRR